ncbi:MAG: hypothetical protein Q9217_005039 [Psora testacea]
MPSSDHDMFDIAFVQDSVNSLTESLEAHFESVAHSLQDTFRTTPWLPDSIKPTPKPPSRIPKVIRPPVGYFEASGQWLSEHRAVTAAIVAFVGTGAFIVWRRRRLDRVKRRAKRAKNGARTEVIILAGSPHSPITRSLALDLERRGFIIYIPVSSLSEEQAIQRESRADIRPLSLDITSQPSSTEETIEKLTNFLNTPHLPIPNSAAHKLRLAAFLFLPPPSYPTGSIVNISSPEWSDVLNNNILAPFTTLHAFLPLLTFHQSNVVFLISSINPSFTPPSHAPESVVAGALQQYVWTLRKELSTVNVVQLQLGHFDFGTLPGEHQQLVLAQDSSRAELTKRRLGEKTYKGSPLRELHNGIFDAIVRGKGRGGTIFVGRGSRTYDLVGRWVPPNIVEWMLGRNRSNEPVLPRTRSGDSLEGSVEWEKLHGL